MRRAMSRELKKRAHRDRNPYDGVRGEPPKWLPSPLVDEFYAARDNLLPNHSAKQIARWMNACLMLGSYPFEYVREIEALVYIEQLVGLGESDGIDAYLGRGRYRVRRAYTEQAPKPDDVILHYDEELANTKRSSGGRNAAEAKRVVNAPRDNEIREEALRLRAKGISDRAIPTMLKDKKKWKNSKGNPLSRNQIERIIEQRD